MTVTLADLRTAVNRRLMNNLERQSSEATADGAQTTWKLPDENIVDVELCTVGLVTLTESATSTPGPTEYVLEPDAGWIIFGTSGDNGDTIHWDYTYRRWSEEQVDEAVNAALDYIFGEFYGRTVDTNTVTNGTTYEFWAPNCEQVHEVSHQYSGGTRYSRLEDWRPIDYPDYIVTSVEGGD